MTPPREETTIITSPPEVEPTTQKPKTKGSKGNSREAYQQNTKLISDKKNKPEKEANSSSIITTIGLGLVALLLF